MSSLILTNIYTLSEIFSRQLQIPDYQRPYKWREEHVYQLLNDLLDNFEKNERTYRLGTIVIHKEKDKTHFDIVDGQQRSITLSLILKNLGKDVSFLESKVAPLSARNIIQNNQIIRTFIESRIGNKESFLKYIWSKCEMVYIELSSVEEAFQFFDSQNARGKPLEPYDLLKAYHLREMQDEHEQVVFNAVENWESAVESKDEKATLKMIINETLFKLRVWNRGDGAEVFQNRHISQFKGVGKNAKYPYLRPLLAGQAMYDANQSNPFMYDDIFDKPAFQINQVIINGKYFFDYIDYYRKAYDFLFHFRTGYLNKFGLISSSEKTLLDFLRTHKGIYRTGDWYLLILFKCNVLLYFDKFGLEKLDEAISLIFKWVYKTRLEQERISFRTIENLVNDDRSLTKVIEYALEPNDILGFLINPVEKVNYLNAQDIQEILENMGMIDVK